MKFIKTLLAKSRGTEPDDTLVHLECPVQMPMGSPFQVIGWVVSRFEIRRVRIFASSAIELELVERPDVVSAYPTFPHVKGFIGTARKEVLEGHSLSLQLHLGETIVSYPMALAINPLPSVRSKEKSKKLKRIAPHLLCVECGTSLGQNDFNFESTSLVCTRCGCSYSYNKNGFNFLSKELKDQFKISETENVSSHPYCPFALSIIATHNEGLILDCGAGRRINEYANVISFDVVDYPSTDVTGVNEKLPFKDETFDAVFSLSVLEHVKNPFQSAREIVRVLKKGGLLYCIVPFLQPLHSYPNHFYNMTHQGLMNLFEGDIEIIEQGVPSSGLPVSTLTSFLRSWADGLEGTIRQDFLNLRVADLIGSPENYLEQEFVTTLPEGKNFELASTTVIVGKKS